MTMPSEEWDALERRWRIYSREYLHILASDDPDWNRVELRHELLERVELRLLEMPAPHLGAVLWKAERILQGELVYPASLTEPFLHDFKRLLGA